MQSLDEKTWKPVSIGSQFDLYRGRESKTTVIEGGVLPFVSAKKADNGYRMFVKSAKTTINGNTISLNNNGDGGAGFGFYQPHEYTIDVNTTALVPLSNVPMSTAIGLFWTGCFSWMHKYFGNARTLSNKRAEITKIMLPVTDAGEPDYEYMAEYAQNKREEMLTKYREYVEARIAELGDAVEVPALDEKEWKPFPVVSLFSSIVPGKGKGLNHLNKTDEGGVNDIGATNRNNGVLCRVVEDAYSRSMILDGNCIGFIKNGDGSAGFAIYKAERFISTSDVLYGYADWINEFTGLFFVVAQDMIEHKYSHGYKRNKEHLAGDKVMLPVTDSGEPDYEYMEQYAKNMMLRKYRQYLSFIRKALKEQL